MNILTKKKEDSICTTNKVIKQTNSKTDTSGFNVSLDAILEVGKTLKCKLLVTCTLNVYVPEKRTIIKTQTLTTYSGTTDFKRDANTEAYKLLVDAYLEALTECYAQNELLSKGYIDPAKALVPFTKKRVEEYMAKNWFKEPKVVVEEKQ